MSAQVQYLTATADQAGQRIDNFLLHFFQRVPKSRIYKALRKGEVRVNRKRIKPTYRICDGDLLRLPPLDQAPATHPLPPTQWQLEQVSEAILYEDDELLVLNKPANIAVHGGTGVDSGVIERLRALRGTDGYLELAHRLDRPTSGCLLVAKTRRQLIEIQQSLQSDSVNKQYLCLVEGDWPAQGEKVTEKLASRQYSGMQKMVIDAEGKDAVSIFTRIETLPGCSLMAVSIETGRTHQIRVHAAARGHPLAGDTRYGDKEFNCLAKEWGLQRLFLHAETFEFRAEGDAWRRFHCPLAADLQAVLTRLRAA